MMDSYKHTSLKMIKVKGTTVTNIHKLFSSKPPKLEADFKLRLSAEASDAYEKALPVSWIDVNLYSEILEKSKDCFFPEHKNPIVELGKEGILDNFTGIYRFMFKFTTVSFLVLLGPKVWNIYFDKGRGYVEHFDRKGSGKYIVKDVPELPPIVLDIITGGIIRFFEIARAKNVTVQLINNNPDAWQWNMTWTLK